MDALDVVLLVAGGLFAGCVNTIAGGGSLLTVPLLVLVGVPGDVANGTNRLGILTSNVSAAEEFRRQGVAGLSRVVPVLVPVVVGALLVVNNDSKSATISPLSTLGSKIASGPAAAAAAISFLPHSVSRPFTRIATSRSPYDRALTAAHT